MNDHPLLSLFSIQHNSRPEEDNMGDNDESDDVQVDENEAPESVQDIGQPSPWSTYPDLLVPTNSSSACLEEDQPESQLSFARRICPSAEASGLHHRHHHSPRSNSPSISGNVHDTGAIPKRVALPPDVSIGGPAQAASSGPNLIGNDLLNTSGSMPLATHRSAFSNASLSRGDQLQGHDRVQELEHGMMTLATQKALLEQQLQQQDNQIRNLTDSASGQQPAVAASLASVAASVTGLTQAMERMARDVTDRLDRLESRLNILTVAENGALTLDSTAAIRQELRSLSEQQRRVSLICWSSYSNNMYLTIFLP